MKTASKVFYTLGYVMAAASVASIALTFSTQEDFHRVLTIAALLMTSGFVGVGFVLEERLARRQVRHEQVSDQ